MVDMGIETNQFFLNIAAVYKHRCLLENAVLFHLRAEHLPHSRLQALRISAQDGAAVSLDPGCRSAQMCHSLAQFPLDASAFLLAHFVEKTESFLNGRHDSTLQFLPRTSCARTHGAWHAQHNVQVRLAFKAKLSRRRTKGLHVAGNQFPVQSSSIFSRTIKSQTDLDMAARQFFLQQTAQLHFQSVRVGRQPEMKIEKSMIHRFQGQHKRQAVTDLASDLRKSGHGTKRHKVQGFGVRLSVVGLRP